jgi:hypothetical protein
LLNELQKRRGNKNLLYQKVFAGKPLLMIVIGTARFFKNFTQ